MKAREIVGPRHAKAAMETIPGRLAAALSELLYSAYVPDEKDAIGKQYYRCPLALRKLDKQPWNCKHWVSVDGAIEVEAMLRECRDLLEAYAFREVID